MSGEGIQVVRTFGSIGIGEGEDVEGFEKRSKRDLKVW